MPLVEVVNWWSNDASSGFFRGPRVSHRGVGKLDLLYRMKQ